MNYLNITYPDINNGSGIRATIWFAGCPYKCEGCHNPETWKYNQGTRFDPELVFNEILLIIKEHPYINGITLSGGDPFGGKSESDLNDLYCFLQMFNEEFPDKTIWAYSGAYIQDLLNTEYRNIFFKIFKSCDIIVDGPYEQHNRDITLPFRGSTNQRIIDRNFNLISDSCFRD